MTYPFLRENYLRDVLKYQVFKMRFDVCRLPIIKVKWQLVKPNSRRCSRPKRMNCGGWPGAALAWATGPLNFLIPACTHSVGCRRGAAQPPALRLVLYVSMHPSNNRGAAQLHDLRLVPLRVNASHRGFLEHWNSQKSLCNIWQRFSSRMVACL